MPSQREVHELNVLRDNCEAAFLSMREDLGVSGADKLALINGQDFVARRAERRREKGRNILVEEETTHLN
jgi:hypothetical protein